MASAKLVEIQVKADPDVVAACEHLLEKAKSGELTTVYYTGELTGGFYIEGMAGILDSGKYVSRLLSLTLKAAGVEFRQ